VNISASSSTYWREGGLYISQTILSFSVPALTESVGLPASVVVSLIWGFVCDMIAPIVVEQQHKEYLIARGCFVDGKFV
jgi:hypothetical protein